MVNGIDEAAVLLAAMAAGAAMGALYMYLLWRMTLRLPESAAPGRAVLLGAAGRITLLTGGLWLIAGGDPARLFAALVGFLVARHLAVRRAGRNIAARHDGAAE